MTIRRDRLYHYFHERRAGDDLVDFFGNKNFHQPCARPERTLRCQQRRADESLGAGYQADAAKLILIRVVIVSGKQPAKSYRTGDDFFWFRSRRPQFFQRNNFNPTYIIQRTVSDETRLGVTNCNGKIRDYAVAIRLA